LARLLGLPFGKQAPVGYHHISLLLMNKPTSAGFPSRLAVTYRAVGDLIPDPRRGADRDLVAGE
jgi:hypothetical protein